VFQTVISEDEIFKTHLTGRGHPESPSRFKIAKDALKLRGLLSPTNRVAPRLATSAELMLCHTQDYIQTVQENMLACVKCGREDGSFTLSTGDVQICSASDQVARYAVGAVLGSIDAIMLGQALNAFCLVRPPGHHACSDKGMGFCIYNNVSIGARYLIQKYGIERVLIVDWDVHHGNGTQEIFYQDPSVFYFSTHNKHIYPGTGFSNERGAGLGLGYTLNFPLEGNLGTRTALLEIFNHSLREAMKIYKPQFVLISAGFDAHEWDPLGGFNLTTEDFRELTSITKGIAFEYAEGRLLSVLEGGYSLRALEEVIPAHVGVLQESD